MRRTRFLNRWCLALSALWLVSALIFPTDIFVVLGIMCSNVWAAAVIVVVALAREGKEDP